MVNEELGSSTTSDTAEATRWMAIFTSHSVEDVLGELRKVEPFYVDEANRSKVSGPLNCALNSLVDVVVGDEAIESRRMKEMCGALFVYFDLYILTLKRIVPKIANLSSNIQKWNVYRLLRFFPLPTKKYTSPFYQVEANYIRTGPKNSKLKLWYQEAWLALLRHELPRPLLKRLVPYLGDSVLAVLRDASLTGDFLFRVFRLGDVFAVISLSAIFRLIMEYNFEFPEFFERVYALTTPSVCYLSYRKQFFSLLDTFLSSTHLASYIVAAFLKRLARMALLAPLCSQEPLLSLIRNLLTRHEGVRVLLHRDNPATLEADPYNMDETRLKLCGALDSSLWEVKTLQRHWYGDVARRGRFVDRGVQRVESFVRWKDDEEYFSRMMSTRFGTELAKHALEEKYRRAQSGDSDEEVDDDDAEEEPQKKRARRFRKEGNMKSELSMNSHEPGNNFFPDSFLLNIKDYCEF